MKILLIHCAYKYKGGEDTVVYQEMALLRSRNNEVDLLEFSNEGNALFKILQLPFNIIAYRKVKNKIKQYQPDIVHIHNWHFGASPSIIYAVKSLALPIVITLHNFRLLCPSAMLFHDGHLFLESLTQKFPWTAVRKGVYHNSKMLTFWIALSIKFHTWIGTWKICDRYIVLSEYARILFQNSRIGISKRQLVIKANFSDINYTSAEKKNGQFLYIGRLSKEKGVNLLIEAFSESGYQLKIAGDGPLKNDVESACKIHHNITYLGSIDKQLVHELLCESSALIFPSIWYEGMPLTIIEAFACGLPVIGSNIGAMQTMITHNYNGLHFEVGNKNDLLNKLKLWNNLSIEQKRSFQQNALSTYKDNYTPQQNADQLLAIYNSVAYHQPLKKHKHSVLKMSGE